MVKVLNISIQDMFLCCAERIFICTQYIEDDASLSGKKEKSKKVKAKESSRNNTLRIQDRELLEMTDEGEIKYTMQLCVTRCCLLFHFHLDL